LVVVTELKDMLIGVGWVMNSLL